MYSMAKLLSTIVIAIECLQHHKQLIYERITRRYEHNVISFWSWMAYETGAFYARNSNGYI